MPTVKRKRKLSAVTTVTSGSDRKSFDEIMTLKEAGHFEQFTKLLKKEFVSDDIDLRAQACYELALLNCQQNNHEEADRYLRKLGYRYKLNRNIWKYNKAECDFAPGDLHTSTGFPGMVHCFNEVIPQVLLSKLRDAFSPSSPFWAEHGYPADSFFSYNVPLSSHKDSTQKKKKKKKACANLMEQLAQFLKPIVAASFPQMAIEETASIEWWAHTRSNGASAGHRLHYDLDEVSLQEHGELSEQIHPFVSSVLYLDDGGSSGAPTLVTNQSVLQNMFCTGSDVDSEESNWNEEKDENELNDNDSEQDSGCSEGNVDTEEMAWLCPPQTNRLLLFDGSLLHGVVPHIDNSRHAAPDSPRVTLMIGWWGSHVATSDTPKMDCVDSSGRQQALTNLKPNMRMPVCINNSSEVRVALKEKNKNESETLLWPELFKIDANLDTILNHAGEKKHQKQTLTTSAVQPSAGLVQVEGGIWEEVSDTSEKTTGKDGGSQEVLESDIQFLGNWFLHSRTEILDEIEYGSEMCRAAATGSEGSLRSCGVNRSQSQSQSHSSAVDDASGAVGWMSAEDLKRLRGE